MLTSSVCAPAAGGRLCGGKRASLPAARPFPVIQKVMASMAHLQEEKRRLQEELLGLQEKLAARESEELSRSLQLQGQVRRGQGDGVKGTGTGGHEGLSGSPAPGSGLAGAPWLVVSEARAWMECRTSIMDRCLHSAV